MQAKELPDGWVNEALSDIASAITSGATPRSGSTRYYTEVGGIKFAKIDDLTAAEGRYIDETFLHVTPVALSETALSLYPAGTLLLSMYGTIGLVKTTSSEMSANQALAALLPPFSCDSNYLAHALIWSRSKWDRYKSQTTQANINGRIVKAFRLDLPPLPEQCRIAEILDTLDEAIRKTEQVIAKLHQMKQGLLHDLLTRGIDQNGELRDPERHPEQFKDSPLGRIPRGWEVGPLGCFLVGIDAGWSPACPEEPPTQGQWGVLKVSAVSSGVYRPRESKRLPHGLQPMPSLEVHPGDVLCVRANGVAELVGRSAYVESTPSLLMLSDKTLRLLPTDKILPQYLHFLLSGASLRRQIGHLLNGTSGQRNISQAQIRSLAVAVPSVTDQRVVEAAVASHEWRLQLEQAQLAKLRILKQGLMDDLLTGHVRVNLQEGAK